MREPNTPIRVAVLDDWQGVARESADWSRLAGRAEVTFFGEPFASEDEAANDLEPFEVLVPMRERTAFAAGLLRRLPRVRLIAMTGRTGRTLDLEACTARGVLVCNTGGERSSAATSELAIGLLLAAVRRIPRADAAMRTGGYQGGVGVGAVLEGATLGVVGLGRIGARVARVGLALGMRVLAWSQHLTEERAHEVGAQRVSLEHLLEASDAVTLHLVLSERSRGLIGAAQLSRMKPGAVLVNTSRGPLVDEGALLAALHSGRLLAALDVYDEEPPPPEHPLRRAPNTVLTPHLGYAAHEVFAQFYGESLENVLAYLDGSPIRLVNPEVLAYSPSAPPRS